MNDEMFYGILIGMVLAVFIGALPTIFRTLKKFIKGELELREKREAELMRRWVQGKYLGREEAKSSYVNYEAFRRTLDEEFGKAFEEHERKWNHSAPYANRVTLTDDKS